MKVDKRVIQEKITLNQEEQYLMQEVLKHERSMSNEYISKRKMVVRALQTHLKALKRKKSKAK